MNMEEGLHTEFKEKISERITQAAVAFSNTDGGTIYVGIKDNGEIVGVNDTDDTYLKCVQLLKDKVRPDIMLTSHIEQVKLGGKDIVRIDILEGDEKPYYLRDKGLRAEGVYIRKGTSNQPVSEEALRTMLQRPRSRSFERMISFRQDLTFEFTASVFRKKGLKFGEEQMKSLHLIENSRYTNLAFMLSDQFDVPVKAALFEDEFKGSFLDRAEFQGSILEQFDGIMRFISGHNTKRSVIEGIDRKDTTAYPVVAVREAVLNALVHRDYSMQGTILISMYPDRLTISSPGGLNEIYSIDDLKIGISSTRNPNLANVMYRLGYIEAYGTGIPRIMKLYLHRGEPEIKVSDAVFFISLPSMLMNNDRLESLLRSGDYITRVDLESIGYSRSAAVEKINSLIEEGRIERSGGGRSTRYRVLE